MSDTSQGPDYWLASDGKWYPPSGPTPEGPKKSRTWLIVAGSVVGFFILLAIIGAIVGPKKSAPAVAVVSTTTTAAPTTSTTTHPIPAPPTTATTAPSGPGLNQVAKDGSFAFTVTGMQCGVTSIGTDPLSSQAPAGTQWCLVTMTVSNDKSSSQTFFASNQKAIDTQGRQLAADTGAMIYMAGGAASELAQINPGISITATVPFQLSTSDSIKSFELHDSAFSNGVVVRAS